MRRRSGVLTFLCLVILAAAAPAFAQVTGASFQFEFLDRTRNFQRVPQFPYNTPNELVLASQTIDVRQLLPIDFIIRANGQEVFRKTASDPRRDCRGPTGCSVEGPVLPDPGGELEVVAFAGGREVARHAQGTPAPPPSSPSAPALTRPQSPEASAPSPVIKRRTGGGEEPPWFWFWCCWDIWITKVFFVLVFFLLIVFWVRLQSWFAWGWWFFILIFFWFPFLFAGVLFFRPWWWWGPILPLFPMVGGFFWWARGRPWWSKTLWPVALAWWLLMLGGIALLGRGSWLIPALWLPWVVIWILVFGVRQPWWRWWLLLPIGGFLVAVFGWIGFGWFTPYWGWFIPAIGIAWFLVFLPWWNPKWTWAVWWGWFYWGIPWILLPWLIWGNFFWDPWWLIVFVAVLLFFFFLAIVFAVRFSVWWSWWRWWLVLIFVWIPVWLGWLFFWNPWWWWIGVLTFIPIAGAVFLWWGRLSWWKAWMWLGLPVWWGLIGAGAYYWRGEWWFLLPVLWLPFVGIYLAGHGRGRPWWSWWLWILFAGWVFLGFAWLIWWGPGWWWLFSVFAIPLIFWWLWWSRDQKVFWPKCTWLLSWTLVPLMVYPVFWYCSPPPGEPPIPIQEELPSAQPEPEPSPQPSPITPPVVSNAPAPGTYPAVATFITTGQPCPGQDRGFTDETYVMEIRADGGQTIILKQGSTGDVISLSFDPSSRTFRGESSNEIYENFVFGDNKATADYTYISQGCNQRYSATFQPPPGQRF